MRPKPARHAEAVAAGFEGKRNPHASAAGSGENSSACDIPVIRAPANIHVSR
jgi:hypothetical protein